MKLKNIFAFSVAAFSLLALSSCLKDQEDVFERGSADRMSDYLEEVRSTLKAPKYGWKMAYYPGADYAATNFTLIFEDQYVTAAHESAPDAAERSTYKLTTDDGAVLSFDTYNVLLHAYATPDSKKYQAKGGDFEFEIIGLAKDQVTLRGKRSRNLCILRPLDKPGKDFLKAVNEMNLSFDIAAVSATITNGLVEGFLDAGKRRMSIGRAGAPDNEMMTIRYIVQEDGIRLYSPTTIQGVEFDELVFDKKAGTLTGSGVVFNKMIPEGWVSYSSYLGKYTVNSTVGYFSPFTIEFKQLEYGISYEVEGLMRTYKPVIDYEGGRGTLNWVVQAVGGSGSVVYYLTPWSLAENGSLNWRVEGAGLLGRVDDNTKPDFTISFEDNGVWEDHKADSWLIWGATGDTSAGGCTDSNYYFFGTNNYQFPGPFTFTKIKE
ncbi:MAG: DUF4302 domain-containing protein [Bacteroidales bacterium]|nr:DUF4302 domain-containing protein [Bacteroidales bacterium]